MFIDMITSYEILTIAHLRPWLDPEKWSPSGLRYL